MKTKTDKLTVLISEGEIRNRCRELAEQIDREYSGDSLTVVIVLKGALMFGSDLIRLLSTPVKFDTISVSSYIGAVSSGTPEFHSQLRLDLTEQHVLIVDDILETGATLNAIVNQFRKSQPLSIRTCVLLRKEISRNINFAADYVGFDIGDDFVVGYGLDYNDDYRNLPCISTLDSTV